MCQFKNVFVKVLFFVKLLTGLIMLLQTNLYATQGKDSLKIQTTKHFIRPCFYFNHYSTPERRFKSNKQYRFAQNNIGFYIPLLTKSWFNKDSVGISSLHLIGVTDMMQYKPQLSYLNENYRIGRLSAGLRLFYLDGKKSVFYFSFTPFVSQEFHSLKYPLGRYTSAIIYSRTVSKNFAYRLGIARSYTFGTALHLPVVGFRFGAVDKLHFNIQMPKNISVEFPVSKKVWVSVYSKSVGGIYNVETQDTLLAPKGTQAKLRRFELLNGVQFTFRTGNHVSFYVSTGFAARRFVNFTFNDRDRAFANREREKVPNSLFISFGLSIRFGQAKKIYNNETMYDMFDMNSLNKSGFNESGSADNDVPANAERYKVEKLRNIQYKDVEDLVTDDY